ncbi:cell surface glycoprotein [Cyclospora cayetanensis]|uniref:Cell surface glycoprotein n=1 Tax=Cyclospora cayetanensis TaxID=88456 RepID=A0A1D3D617_9EIME|nr:cell surface glycoprotein [Cyclospora cayetanensis]
MWFFAPTEEKHESDDTDEASLRLSSVESLEHSQSQEDKQSPEQPPETSSPWQFWNQLAAVGQNIGTDLGSSASSEAESSGEGEPAPLHLSSVESASGGVQDGGQGFAAVQQSDSPQGASGWNLWGQITGTSSGAEASSTEKFSTSEEIPGPSRKSTDTLEARKPSFEENAATPRSFGWGLLDGAASWIGERNPQRGVSDGILPQSSSASLETTQSRTWGTETQEEAGTTGNTIYSSESAESLEDSTAVPPRLQQRSAESRSPGSSTEIKSSEALGNIWKNEEHYETVSDFESPSLKDGTMPDSGEADSTSGCIAAPEDLMHASEAIGATQDTRRDQDKTQTLRSNSLDVREVIKLKRAKSRPVRASKPHEVAAELPVPAASGEVGSKKDVAQDSESESSWSSEEQEGSAEESTQKSSPSPLAKLLASQLSNSSTFVERTLPDNTTIVISKEGRRAPKSKAKPPLSAGRLAPPSVGVTASIHTKEEAKTLVQQAPKAAECAATIAKTSPQAPPAKRNEETATSALSPQNVESAEGTTDTSIGTQNTITKDDPNTPHSLKQLLD